MITIIKVGLIGAGIVGRRRAQVVKEFGGTDLTAVADVDFAKAKLLADEVGCRATTNWENVVKLKEVKIIIVSTTHKFLAPISIAAMKRGKHVLCEKPLARDPIEAKRMVDIARTYNVKLKTGFNHRHYAGIRKARVLFDKGIIGELIFVRCRYGHGGRPGYEKEWRVDPKIAGGGELLDQGIHALDLFRWFMGDFNEAVGFATTKFWDISPLEDNAFALFRTAKGQVACLHASWTQWKNIFSFEIFGEDGYVIVAGRGGYYGIQRTILGRRSLNSGPPEEEVFEFPQQDRSWHDEWREFIAALQENREPLGNGYDGWQAIRMVYAVYEADKKGCTVKL